MVADDMMDAIPLLIATLRCKPNVVGVAEPESRSCMNVTFRVPSADLDDLFVREAAAAGLDGVKGHRSVGGLRASIYNAMPQAGVDALAQFMREFERTHG